MKTKTKIEAIHLVALAIDAVKNERSRKLLEEAKSIWRKQLHERCPTCGGHWKR